MAHFGNGDEDDQSLVYSYAQQFGDVETATIFPGISYGYLEFKDMDSAIKLI